MIPTFEAIGQIDEVRPLRAKSDQRVWRTIVKLACTGMTLEIAVDPSPDNDRLLLSLLPGAMFKMTGKIRVDRMGMALVLGAASPTK